MPQAVAGLIISALGGAAAVGAAGVALINIGVSLAFTALSSAVAQALAGKNKRSETPGIRSKYTGHGDTSPQTVILGVYATAGHLMAPTYTHSRAPSTLGDTDFGSIGSGDYATFIVNLADAPLTALRAVFVDGIRFDLGTHLAGTAHPHYGTPVASDVGRNEWRDRLWVKFHDGSQTAADPYLRAAYGAHPTRPWKATSWHRGGAYAIVTVKRDDKLLRGEPQLRFEVSGLPLLDPRTGSTAATVNPAVMIHNILRGIALPDGQTFGMQVSPEDLPDAWWDAAMDACDLLVERQDGDDEAQYRAGIEIPIATPDDGGMDPLSAIDALLPSMAGKVADLGGQWIIRAGAPSLPVLAISDDDVLNSREQSYTPFEGLAETHNAVAAVFPNPAAKWEATEAPARFDLEAEAEDGQRLIASLDLNTVPYADQVQRLQVGFLKDATRRRAHVISLPPNVDQVTVLDTLTLSSAIHGYTDKLFEVQEYLADLKTGAFRVIKREVDPDDFTPSPADYQPQPVPVVNRTPASALSLLNVTVAPHEITDGTSGRIPAIRITWELPSDSLSGVAWRIFRGGELVLKGATAYPDALEVILSEGLLPDTTYSVQVGPVARGQATAWSAGVTVTTFDLRIQPGDLDADLLDTIFPATPSVPTGLSVTSSLASDGRVTLVADWSDNPEGNVTHYEVGVTESGGNEIVLTAGASRFEASNVRPNTPFSVRVRAVNTMGDKSDWTVAQAHTTAKDNTPPPAPVLGAVVAGFDALWLSWTLTEPVDMSHYEIVERATNSAPGVSTTPNFFTTSKTFARTGLGAGTKRYYWVRAVDTSGNASGWSSVQSATTAGVPGVTSEDIAGLVDQTSFASGLTGVEIVGTLPTTGNFEGRTVLLTTDGKLYRYRAVGGWTNEVDGADLKADSVTTGAVAAGAIKTAQLAAGAATIEKLSIGDFTNLVENPGFELVDENGDLLGWDLQGSASDWLRPVGSTHARSGTGSLQHSTSTLHSQAAAGTNIVVAAEGDEFFLSGWILGDAVFSHAGVRMVCFDAAGVSLGGLNVTTTTQPGWGNSNWVRVSGIVTALPGTATVRFDLSVFDQSSGTIRWDDVYWSRANAGELTVDGGIKARHVGTNEIIANTANVKDGILTNAKIANLSAAKLLAGTALASSVTVNGTALGTINGWASDPAARVNAASTSILPGKITISGGTSLESWRRAGDTTKIDGGAISSASVTTDKLTVGNGKNLYNDAAFATGDALVRQSGSGGINAQSNLAVRAAGSQWAGSTYPTLRLEQNGTATDGYVDILPIPEPNTTESRYVPVKPGQWYELSVYTSTHRCTGRLYLQFFQADGTAVPGAPWSDFGQDSSSSANPDEWPRRWMKAQAPAGAAFVRPIFRKFGTLSLSNSYLFLHKPMLAETHAEATEPAPWSSGAQTTIDGGMVKTGAIESTNHVLGSVGWSIDVAGNAEFNNLIVRNSLVQGAVTDGSVERAAAEATRANNYVVCEVYSGPISFDEFWHLSVMGATRLYREEHYYNSNTGTAGLISHKTRLQLRILTKNDGVWDAGWTPLWSSSAGNGDQSYFVQNQMTVHYAGDHEDMRVQLLLTIDVSGTDNGGQPTGTDTYTNIRSAGLVVQSMSQR